MERVFADAVCGEVESAIGVSVPRELFILQDINFPTSILDSSLAAVTTKQSNVVAAIQQQSAVIAATTDALVSSIDAQTNYTLAVAAVNANTTVAASNSYASQRELAAQNVGIMNVARLLNLSTRSGSGDTDVVLKFVQIMSLFDTNDAKLIVGGAASNLLVNA